MIVIYTKSDIKYLFKVADESKVLAAWRSMRDEEKYATTKFNFKVDDPHRRPPIPEGTTQSVPDVFKKTISLQIQEIKSLMAVNEGAFEDLPEENTVPLETGGTL